MTTKMKLTIILLSFTLTNIVGQVFDFELQNNTGRTIGVFSTSYSLDTTKADGYSLLCRKNCVLKGGELNQGNFIRVDFIAIDDSTKDTVYVKTFNKREIDNRPFIVSITTGDINKLQPELNPLSRLMIKAKSFERIKKVSDPIDLKLINKETIQGFVKAFDKETITILDKSDKVIVIQRKEISGIKTCGAVWAVGSKSFLHNCNYTDLESIRFKTVRQIKVKELNGSVHYEWKE
jgi:hypothetical protein